VTTPTSNRSVDQQDNFPRHAVALLATGVLAVTIAVLTLSAANPKLGGSGWDKLYHLTAFAALVFPCALLYARTMVWLLPSALLYGGAIELIQPYVGRSGEGLDFLADALGVAFGAALGLTLRAILTRRARTST